MGNENMIFGTPLTTVVGKFEKALGDNVRVHPDIVDYVKDIQTTLVQSQDDLSKGGTSGSQVGSPTDTFLNAVKNGMTYNQAIGAPKCTAFDNLFKVAAMDGEVINAAQVLLSFDEIVHNLSMLMDVIESDQAMLDAINAKGITRDQLGTLRDIGGRVEGLLNSNTIAYSALSVMAEYFAGAVDMMGEVHALAERNRGIFNEADCLSVVHALGFDTVISENIRNNMGGANGNQYYKSNEEIINELRADADARAQEYLNSLNVSFARLSSGERAKYNWIKNESWKEVQPENNNNGGYGGYGGRGSYNDNVHHGQGMPHGTMYTNNPNPTPTTPVNKIEQLRQTVLRAGGKIEYQAERKDTSGGIPVKDPNKYNPYQSQYGGGRKWSMAEGGLKGQQGQNQYQQNQYQTANDFYNNLPPSSWIDDNDVYIDGYGNVIQISSGYDVTDIYYAQRNGNGSQGQYNRNNNGYNNQQPVNNGYANQGQYNRNNGGYGNQPPVNSRYGNQNVGYRGPIEESRPNGNKNYQKYLVQPAYNQNQNQYGGGYNQYEDNGYGRYNQYGGGGYNQYEDNRGYVRPSAGYATEGNMIKI